MSIDFNPLLPLQLQNKLKKTTTVGTPGVDTQVPTEKAVRAAISGAGGGDVSGPASATNENITVFSDGSPTRTFCYVADAIIGYFKILINGSKGEAYNIGVERPEISIKEFAERMVYIAKKYFDYTGKIVYKINKDQEYLTDVPNRRCPDITKARLQIGYSPSIDIDEGLLRTMYWYRDNLNVEEE